MRAKSQKNLPFETPKEQDRLDRIERILGGKLRGKVRPASELVFDYQRATQSQQGQLPSLLSRPMRTAADRLRARSLSLWSTENRLIASKLASNERVLPGVLLRNRPYGRARN